MSSWILILPNFKMKIESVMLTKMLKSRLTMAILITPQSHYVVKLVDERRLFPVDVFLVGCLEHSRRAGEDDVNDDVKYLVRDNALELFSPLRPGKVI